MASTAVREKPILFSGPMVRAILDGRKTQTRRVVKIPPWAKGREIIVDNGVVGAFHPLMETESLFHCPFADIGADWSRRPSGVFGGAEYRTGTRLWVREKWCVTGDAALDYPCVEYYEPRHSRRLRPFEGQFRFEDACGQFACWREELEKVFARGNKVGWLPSIHMPRWTSRLTLEITGVRVERLTDISGRDARAEGCEPDWEAFNDATIGMDGWEEPEEFIEECEEECDWVNYGRGLVHSSEHREWERDRVNYALRLAFRKLWESIHGPGSWEASPWVWVVEFRRAE